MTTSSETLIEFTQLKIDQQASKLALSERIEQQLLITHNGGLFKATTELISFLSVWDADELFILIQDFTLQQIFLHQKLDSVEYLFK